MKIELLKDPIALLDLARTGFDSINFESNKHLFSIYIFSELIKKYGSEEIHPLQRNLFYSGAIAEIKTSGNYLPEWKEWLYIYIDDTHAVLKYMITSLDNYPYKNEKDYVYSPLLILKSGSSIILKIEDQSAAILNPIDIWFTRKTLFVSEYILKEAEQLFLLKTSLV